MTRTSTTCYDRGARLAIELLPVSELKLDPENARVHKPAQIRQIAKSIEAFAFNVPVLVDRDLKVISGHGRVLACKLLGRTQVPVIRLEHLDEHQARAFAIAENRLVENSSWDEDLLSLHLKALSELDLDFSLEATGFTMGEIDLKIEGLTDAGDGDADPDDSPPPDGPAVCRAGDVWVLGRHRLICASALEAESYRRLLGDERAHVILTDPPYNVKIHGNVSGKGKRQHREFAMASGEMSEPEFVAFLTQAFQLLADHSVDGAVHFHFIDWRHVFALLAAGRTAYDQLINLCVWAKTNAGMGSLYRSAHELVAVFRHGRTSHRNNVELGRFGRNRTNVWSYPGANTFLKSSEEADLLAQHPTPKPVAMLADALLDVSARNDIVLDAFCGSGSTLIAAERVGRRGRGIELDPLYVDLSIRRWQRLTGDTAILERTGETFDALAAQAAAGA